MSQLINQRNIDKVEIFKCTGMGPQIQYDQIFATSKHHLLIIIHPSFYVFDGLVSENTVTESHTMFHPVGKKFRNGLIVGFREVINFPMELDKS